MSQENEQINYLDHWPESIRHVAPTELYGILGGPTFIEIEGKNKAPLVVTTLLHGNETTGFLALQRVMNSLQLENLPRSITILLGNLKAAEKGLRHLPDQPDYNRIWGTHHPFANEATNHLQTKTNFAYVDIHNNTGRNPHYACVSSHAPEFLHLGLMYSRNLVYFQEPSQTFSVQMTKHAPAVVLECGKSSDGVGVDHATTFLQAMLRLDHLPEHEPAKQDMNLYEMQIALKIPQESTVGIGQGNVDFGFDRKLDQLNFIPSDQPRLIGWRRNESIKLYQESTLPHTQSDSGVFYEGNEIWLQPHWVPSMFTLDTNVMRSDCLGYLMRTF